MLTYQGVGFLSGSGRVCLLSCLFALKRNSKQSQFKSLEVVRMLWCGNLQRMGIFLLIRLIRVFWLILVCRTHLRELGYGSLILFQRLGACSGCACIIVHLWGRSLRAVVSLATLSVLCVKKQSWVHQNPRWGFEIFLEKLECILCLFCRSRVLYPKALLCLLPVLFLKESQDPVL